MPRPVIAFLTDFGLADHYVGAMKGVVAGICPDATLIDISHDVPPQDIRTGALELEAVCRYFPAGTVFLVVIDPGVGSARRAVAVRAGGRSFVGPDNGVLSLAVDSFAVEVGLDAVELREPLYALPAISHTFEGRDRFAPAAAWLAGGVDLPALGPRVESIERLPMPAPRLAAGMIDGEILLVDRFGNLTSNISASLIDRMLGTGTLQVVVGGRQIDGLCRTYADVEQGTLCALVGSSGRLEIAVAGGSAAAVLDAGRGAAVRARRRT